MGSHLSHVVVSRRVLEVPPLLCCSCLEADCGHGKSRAPTLAGDELAAFVAASCVRHGVPVKLEDVGALAVVATLLQGRDSRTTASAVGG